MKKYIWIASLLLTKLTSAQIANGNFEVWDTIGTCSYCSNLIDLFGVPDPTGGSASSWTNGGGDGDPGVKRTTDSHSGSYSILLHDWYSEVSGWITYIDTISFRPQFFQGYYKYNTTSYDGISHGIATVTLTRFNGTSNDTIATGTFQFDSASYFIPFQLSLNYFSGSDPDSINIYIINDKNGNGCLHSPICDLLYLDDLALTSVPLTTEDLISTKSDLTIYPNPSYNELSIQNNSNKPVQFSFYNSLGEILISKLLTDKTNLINVSSFSNGIYFYMFTSERNTIQTGKIIKQ